jgi:hypothetical protein
MTNAGEVNIKVGITLTRQEYSVLKERIKDDECGWSKSLCVQAEKAHRPKLVASLLL